MNKHKLIFNNGYSFFTFNFGAFQVAWMVYGFCLFADGWEIRSRKGEDSSVDHHDSSDFVHYSSSASNLYRLLVHCSIVSYWVYLRETRKNERFFFFFCFLIFWNRCLPVHYDRYIFMDIFTLSQAKKSHSYKNKEDNDIKI